MKVSIVSFNILGPMWTEYLDEGFEGYYAGLEELLPFELRRPLILAVIEHYDIVCLQEVQEDVVSILRTALGESHVCTFAPHQEHLWQPHDGMTHGQAVFVHKRVLATSAGLGGGGVEAIPLPLSSDGNVALVCRFRLPIGRSVVVFNSHLSCETTLDAIEGTPEARLRAIQMRRLLAWRRDHIGPEALVLWGGDFNAPATNPEFSHIFKDGFEDLCSDTLSHRTEFDDNMHLYTGPVDCLVAAPQTLYTKLHVHAFKRPPQGTSIKEKVAFLLQSYGSDHLPVGATVFVRK